MKATSTIIIKNANKITLVFRSSLGVELLRTFFWIRSPLKSYYKLLISYQLKNAKPSNLLFRPSTYSNLQQEIPKEPKKKNVPEERTRIRTKRSNCYHSINELISISHHTSTAVYKSLPLSSLVTVISKLTEVPVFPHTQLTCHFLLASSTGLPLPSKSTQLLFKPPSPMRLLPFPTISDEIKYTYLCDVYYVFPNQV